MKGAIFKPQIVHESATQRQHIRVQIPAQVEINGRVYLAHNLSIGGIAILGFEGKAQVGSLIDATVRFPFDGFEFLMPLPCEVRHRSPDGSVTGLQFVQPNRGQLSLLHFIVDAFLAGEVVTAGDIFAIVQRDNFTSAREVGGSEEKQAVERLADMIRRRATAFLFLLLAGGLLTFIISNIFSRAMVVRADGTVVSSRMEVARAPTAVTLLSFAVPAGARVRAGTTVAMLATAEGHTVDLKSRCDCIVADQLAKAGTMLPKGSPVAALTPANGADRALLTLPLDELRRVRVGDRVSARFYDSDDVAVGTIVQVAPPRLIGADGAPANAAGASGQVRVKFATKLPARRVGQPISARIRVSRFQPFA